MPRLAEAAGRARDRAGPELWRHGRIAPHRLVDAALSAHPEITPQRAVSRVSTATGLNRREVTRLIHSDAVAGARRSPATQLFTRWLSDPIWRVTATPAASLPRTGAAQLRNPGPVGHQRRAPAQPARRAVPPRPDPPRRGHRPRRAAARPLQPRERRAAHAGLLASNVGDHLRASVANVLATGEPPHVEQAVFADELSRESVQQFQPLVREQWRAPAARSRPGAAATDRRRPCPPARARPARARGPVRLCRGNEHRGPATRRVEPQI